ncbi:MAG TPA: YigZ family protein [Phaeodactylibacter sp.]|nr:YigZ family protein [Phaeodactylibacter sp.]
MNYKTISTSSTGEFKDRGSKFIAYAYPAYSEMEWQEHLENVKKEHFKARHHCYAFRLGLDKNNFRANDDGEPSGTAGRPILGQIDSFGLTNVVVIVVRYFGGTKLGTSGLINAYRTSTKIALENADIIDKTLDDIFQITFDYALMSEVMNTVKKIELEIVQQDFGAIGKLQIAIPKSDVNQKMILLKAGIAKVRVEEVEDLEKIDGAEIEYLFTR